MLFIVRSPEMPTDLDGAAGKAAMSVNEGRPKLCSFKAARAKIDALKGPMRRVPLSAVLFPVAGSVSVRATGAGVVLRDERVFIAAPGDSVQLNPLGDNPVYLLLITPPN